MDESDVKQAIEPMVEALRADGAGVKFVGIEGRQVDLRLSVTDASCVECIMPGEVLESLLLAALVNAGHDVDRVRLEDLRTTTD